MLERLMGVDYHRTYPHIEPWDQSPLIYHNIIQKLKNWNANAIRIHFGARQYLEGGLYRDAIKTAQAQARSLGVKLIISGHSDQLNYWVDDWAHKASVILNEGGLGDQWINDYVQVIQDLQPDGIEIMNEPPDAELSGNPNLTFEAWRNFCIRAATAYRNVKPDLLLFIDGCPFWDLNAWATAPLPFSNVYYAFHEHYGAGGYEPSPPPDWDNFAWWNAYWTGDLAQAKILLEDRFLRGGLRALSDKGMRVQFTESGTSMEQPNWDAWLRDMYAIAAKYNANFLQHSMGGNPPDLSGILNDDWTTLNAMGLIWAENMLQAPPPPTYHTLIVTATTGGTTNPAPGRYDVEEGTSAVVTAIPDASYRFVQWELDGTIKTENPITIIMSVDYSLRAIFEELPPPPPEKRYLTIVTINGQTNPTPNTYEVDINSTITVTATPNSGYRFKEWLLDNVQAGTEPFITVTMDVNHTLVAIFEEIQIVQAGFPIWVIPVTLLGAGVLYLATKKK